MVLPLHKLSVHLEHGKEETDTARERQCEREKERDEKEMERDGKRWRENERETMHAFISYQNV